MTKKKVYIFNSNSRAAVYGIGTYITQLTDCLQEEDDSRRPFKSSSRYTLSS